MKELEENLLYKLVTIEGSVLDDPDLIDVLHTTKKTAGEVSEKLAIATDTEIEINTAREEYRPGTVLLCICMWKSGIFLSRKQPNIS